MENRRKTLLIVLGGVVVVALIAWFFVNRMTKTTDTDGSPIVNEEVVMDVFEPVVIEEGVDPNKLAQEVEEANTIVAPTTSDPETELEVGLEGLTSSFVERLGSYSSDANYSNIKDLYPMMTPTYNAQMKKFVADGQIDPNANYSVVTKVLTAEVEDNFATTASVTVTLQKEKKDFGVKSRIYQKAFVDLEKINDEWLVDKVTWGEENVL